METYRSERKTRVTLLLLTALLAAVMVFVSACGGSDGGDSSGAASTGGSSASGSSAEGSAEKTVIKLQGIGGDPTRLDAATIALAKGFFEKQNIEIEDVGVVEIPQHVSALASGTVDAISLMTSEGLAAVDNDADIVQVAIDQYTVEGLQHMTFLVKGDSKIKSGKDLVGKKIGTASASGGCTAGFPIEYMNQDGVDDPKSQCELLTIPEESLVTSLEAGDADVIGVHLTEEQTRTLYPDTKVLFTDYDILGEKGGDTGWFFRRDYIEENPDVIKRFITAITETQHWINENREEAGEVYKENAISLNPDLFWIAHFSDDGIADESHVQLWIDLFGSGQSSYTLQNKDIKPADFVTNEYNPNFKG